MMGAGLECKETTLDYLIFPSLWLKGNEDVLSFIESVNQGEEEMGIFNL